MNNVTISGHLIGNTENNQKLYTYYPGNEQKKSVVNFLLSVVRPFAKKDENGHYPTDLFSCKAFGTTADFIDKYFKPGDAMEIPNAYLSIEEGSTKEDGTKYPSRTVLIVNNPGFAPASRNRKDSASGSQSAASTVVKATPAAKKTGGFQMKF